MASKAKHTKLSTLKRETVAGSGTYTLIGELTSIKGPAESAETIDVTSLDSTSKEYISGLPEGGEWQIEGNFIGSDAEQQGLRADFNNQTLRNFQFILNDHATTKTTMTFAALVSKPPEITTATNAAFKFSATLKVSGAINISQYAPS